MNEIMVSNPVTDDDYIDVFRYRVNGEYPMAVTQEKEGVLIYFDSSIGSAKSVTFDDKELVIIN